MFLLFTVHSHIIVLLMSDMKVLDYYFIAMNSPDDSLLLSWVHSESLPSDSDKSTLLSILDPTLVC